MKGKGLMGTRLLSRVMKCSEVDYRDGCTTVCQETELYT